MNIKKLLEILREYDETRVIDCIHYDENSGNELTIDVYDNETGESWIDFYDTEER